jgi:biotin synthase
MLTQAPARSQPSAEPPPLRHDWSEAEVVVLFALPFHDLLHRAQSLHRAFFDPGEVQLSTLLNIKSGGCPEDCAYCPQSARYRTGVEAGSLMPIDDVVDAARRARDAGATRFCMGAAWRNPRGRDFDGVLSMVRAVKALGLETCATLGMLDETQARALHEAGLDYYNHNLDTSESYYREIISTRQYRDRLDTLAQVRAAGISVCCGGIVGMGETRADRAAFLRTLANLPRHPESVPINLLIRVPGTPLAEAPEIDPFEFVRTIAAARIMMPASYVRLSAGRNDMPDALQALCFHAGANSIFYGEKLLTTDNPQQQQDRALLDRLDMRAGG